MCNLRGMIPFEHLGRMHKDASRRRFDVVCCTSLYSILDQQSRCLRVAGKQL